MSDWLNQFTSSYASSIAYGISVFILSILIKPMFSFFSRWVKRFAEMRRSKQPSKIVLPTQKDVQRFSTKQKVTESEWNDAIEFLKNDIPVLTENFDKPELFGDKFFSFFDKNMRAYQFTLGGLALINLVANIFHAPFWQAVSQIILAILLLLSVLAIVLVFVSLFIYKKHENSRVKKIKVQMRNAMEILAPGMAFTYGQLGEPLSRVKVSDLPRLQAELSDIGMMFNLDDMKFAHFLTTASPEKLLPFGEKILKQVVPPDKFANLSPDEKKEGAQVFVDALRMWPISSLGGPYTHNKKH